MKKTLLAFVFASLAVAAVQAEPKGRIFSEMLYGTEYYRAPTPLSDEWETDISRLGNFHLDTFQIRINWRNNERVEDVYTFDDVDKLMDLAEKYHKKVVIKFLLECAPQYIYDKYDGTRIGPKGELIRGASHGAFYTGGWLPCFTNPKVSERAAKFVRVFAERYAKRPNLWFWSAWNEPRNKPVEECFCKACRQAFGQYLKEKYGTIEKLNAYYDVAEESFEAIALPAMAQGYWDIYEFKQFKSAYCIYNNLKFVYDAIRQFDKDRPIISHIGYTSGFQCALCDVCDDFTVCQAVDGWGTSLPLATKMGTRGNRLEYDRLNEFLRGVNPDYFVYEIYPGLGMYNNEYDNEWDMDYKLYAATARGSKGLFFWQYRSERVGMENDCAGLARSDGSPRPVLNSVKAFGNMIQPLKKDILDFYPPQADIAIVFDYKSLLMSEIMDACGENYAFKQKADAVYYYANAQRGFYHLMCKNDYRVDFLGVKNISKLANYKVAYFPDYEMLDPAILPEIEKFVENGGILIADEGFGLRQPNTWINPYDIACPGLMKARYFERRQGSETLLDGDTSLTTKGYYSYYTVSNAQAALSFKDGTPAAYEIKKGKGRIYLLGFSLGYSADGTDGSAWGRVFDRLTASAGLSKMAYNRFNEDLEERRLVKGNEQFLFLFNTSDDVKRIPLVETVRATYANGRLEGNTAVIPAKSCMILLCNK